MTERYELTNESKGRYLNLPVTEEPDEFEMGMLMKICGDTMLSPKLIFNEDKSFMSFDISDCVSLKQYLAEQPIKEEDIVFFIAQLKNAADITDKFLLGEENLRLNPEMIFVDKISRGFKFCASFSSNMETDENESVKEIMKCFLLAADINDERALKLCVRLYREAERDGCRIFDLINEVLKDRVLSENLKKNIAQIKKDVGRASEQSISATEEEPDLSVNYRDIDKNFIDNNAGEDRYSGIYPDKANINLADLDEEGYENIYNSDPSTENGTEKTADKENKSADMLIKIIITQAIMFAGIAAVTVFKGMSTAIKILPIYAILAVCTVLYIIIGEWAERRKKKAA